MPKDQARIFTVLVKHLPGEEVLLLGLLSTSGFEYLYPALRSVVVLLDVL
jgi:hypothetical protein